MKPDASLLKASFSIEARKGVRATAKVAGAQFGKFADDYVNSHKSQWSNAKHAAQWSMTLGDAYCGQIRPKPVGAIGTEDILAILEPVWHTVPETARRVRMRLEKVLDAARVRGLRTGENPARWKGHLDHLLPKHGKAARGHHAALPWAEVPTDKLAAPDRDRLSIRFELFRAGPR